MGDPVGKFYLRNADNDAWISVAVGAGTAGGGGTASSDGWNASSDTLTYASATTFTVTGDVTTTFQKGTKLRLVQTTTKYFYVVSSAYVDPTTTVTITGGSDYTLANAAITEPYYSYVENPQGFPDWFNYTPVWSASGTMTVSESNVVAKFCIKGRTVFMIVSATLTLGGSASTIVYATLPINYGVGSGGGSGAYYPGSGVTVSGWNFLDPGPPHQLALRVYNSATLSLGSGRTMNGMRFYEME